jgi:hypothetical protein
MPLVPPQNFRKTDGIHRFGTRSAQPSAADVLIGTLYCVTDEGNKIERSNGTTWDAYSMGSPITSAIIQGGTGITDTITIRPTAGAAPSNTPNGSDIIFKVGNAGAEEILRLTEGRRAALNDFCYWAIRNSSTGAITDLMAWNDGLSYMEFYKKIKLINALDATGSISGNDLFFARYLGQNGSTLIEVPANGRLLLTNWLETDFDRLHFGGVSASFPCLKRVTTGLQVRLGDDTAQTSLRANLNGDDVTSGTVLYNRLQLQIVQTTTSTGTVNNFALTAGCTYLRCNNATALTITGIAAGYDGQELTIVSVGAGQVNLKHQNTGSTAANRLNNIATVIDTSLYQTLGYCKYRYDATLGYWKLVQHEQGAAIAYTPTWTASVTNPVIGNGTITGSYYVRGKYLLNSVNITMGSTTTYGSGFWIINTFTGYVGTQPVNVGLGVDVSSGINYGLTLLGWGVGFIGIVTSTSANISSVAPMTWATGDVLNATLELQVG